MLTRKWVSIVRVGIELIMHSVINVDSTGRLCTDFNTWTVINMHVMWSISCWLRLPSCYYCIHCNLVRAIFVTMLSWYSHCYCFGVYASLTGLLFLVAAGYFKWVRNPLPTIVSLLNGKLTISRKTFHKLENIYVKISLQSTHEMAIALWLLTH